MTSPLRAIQTDAGRYYPHDRRDLPSVTTVLGTLGKGDGIVQWAANLAADLAIKIGRTSPIYPHDRDAMRFSWRDARDSAAALGDAVHGHAEWLMAHQGEFVVDDYLKAIDDKKVRNRVKQFIKWLDTYEVVPIYIEATVYNLTVGYAGSCDLMALVDGIPTLVDYKTSKSIRGSVALQCVAYARGEFILTDDGEVLDLPDFERAAVLHIRDRGYVFREVDIGEATYEQFCRLVRTKTDWIDGAESNALLDTIEPTKERV